MREPGSSSYAAQLASIFGNPEYNYGQEWILSPDFSEDQAMLPFIDVIKYMKYVMVKIVDEATEKARLERASQQEAQGQQKKEKK